MFEVTRDRHFILKELKMVIAQEAGVWVIT